MSEKAILAAEGLSVGYGKIIVAEDIDLTVQSGEVLTLIGANGAGKSTVLKSIAAQLPILAGAAFINGENISSLNERDLSRRLSLVLTERITAERMTCRDVAATGRYPYTGRLGILSKEDERAVDEAMELTGISYLADKDFREISDGQRQCVMLARAIAQQTAVMLLDEPTSFLDIDNKLRLLTLLRRLAKERGIAVIMSLHELDLAQRFSDKILCIRGGKVQMYGRPEDVFSGSNIEQLYGIENGTFINSFGTAEPQAVKGEPQVFVIGGGGSGIPIYRQLNREGVPFAAGVIHENDIEYPVAAALAAEVITAAPFEPVTPEQAARAAELIKKCTRVICACKTFGTMNEELKKLKDVKPLSTA